ncbi:MAG: hypothetical protein AAF493_20930 [Pseudomonadota bacterium]
MNSQIKPNDNDKAERSRFDGAMSPLSAGVGVQLMWAFALVALMWVAATWAMGWLA